MGGTHQLSEYELQRLERIRKNEEYLESLGLKQHASKLKAMTEKTKRNKQRAMTRVVNPGEERRSGRIKGDKKKLVMLNYYDGSDDERAIDQDEYFAEDDEDSDDENGTSSKQTRRLVRDTGTDAERPSSEFRTASRISLNRDDLALTEMEKATLAKNTMDGNYLHKFQEFLVYHNKISDQNVRNVMKQVTKLANGEGVRYESARYGWKPHQVFQKGIKVTPLSDFVELLDLARQAEDNWGRDHGNGWLLSHPLKKMLLFQQFCLQNPDFLLSKGKLKEYYQASEIVSTTMEEEGNEEVSVAAAIPQEEEAGAQEAATVTPPKKKKPVTPPKTKKAATPAKKKKAATVTPPRKKEVSKKDAEEAALVTPLNKKKITKGCVTPDDPFVGSQIAKMFGDQVYFGKVTKHLPRLKFWAVVYDDGDREELDRDGLEEAIELFKQESKDKKEIPCTPQLPKRKRGRPRKTEKEDSDQQPKPKRVREVVDGIVFCEIASI